MNTTTITTLFIIPCAATKTTHPAPAAHLYTSPHFRHTLATVTAEAAATDGPTRVLILSARHGLIDPTTTLDPYNTTIGDPDAITPHTLATQLAELLTGHGPTQVHAFLPAAYHGLLTAAADLIPDDSPRWATVHDLYEAAPGIGHHRRVLSTLAALETTTMPTTNPTALRDLLILANATATAHAELVTAIGIAVPYRGTPGTLAPATTPALADLITLAHVADHYARHYTDGQFSLVADTPTLTELHMLAEAIANDGGDPRIVRVTNRAGTVWSLLITPAFRFRYGNTYAPAPNTQHTILGLDDLADDLNHDQ